MTATERFRKIPNQSFHSHRQTDATEPLTRWWRLLGGMLMTLALGSLYAWSVFVTPLEKEFGWKRAQTSTVFTLAVVMFAGSFVFAGRLQDRFGPFWISVTGSILISCGFFLCAYTSSLYTLFFFYGILGGVGNGFGYSTVVPVMAKWFPDRIGLAIGLAIAGYGGGSAIFGSLANLVLFPRLGWRTSCMMLGGIFLVQKSEQKLPGVSQALRHNVSEGKVVAIVVGGGVNALGLLQIGHRSRDFPSANIKLA